MFVWSVLLRVLLSLALILNGMSAVSAAAHASGGHADMRMTVVAGPKVATTRSSCQHHEQALPTAESGETAFTATTHTKQATPDCCESGACRCDCVHAAQAGPMPWTEGPPMFGHTRDLRPPTLAYASPALPHLIRPPIG